MSLRPSLLVVALFVTGMFSFLTPPTAGAETKEQAILRLPLSKIPVTVDGVLKPGEWDDAVMLGGDFVAWHPAPAPIPNSPMVYIKRDAERLYIAYDNPVGAGERPRMFGTIPDNTGICSDNAVELYFMPEKKPGDLSSFIQFGGNGRGAIFDTKRTPQIGISDVAGFTIPWQFKNSFAPGHWYAEVSATFAELGIGSTAAGRSFDADFCRDGGCGGPWGYMATFGDITAGGGVKVIFDDAAPIVQWLSFGEYDKNVFNPSLRIKSSGAAGKYTVSVQVTDAALDPNTQKYPELFSRTATITLGKGQTKDFTVSCELKPKSAGIAHYRITDDKGGLIFLRDLPFTASNRPRTYPKYEAKPFVVKAQMAPSYGRILASADIIDLPGNKTKVRVEVAAFREGQDQPLASGIITNFLYDYGKTILNITNGVLPEGIYLVKFKTVDRETQQPLASEETVKLVRKVYEWENNTIGITDKVMHPWTPMKVEGEKALCWGREYRFTGLGLPESIMTLQPEPSRGEKIKDVLASPVILVAERDGQPVAWKLGTKSIKRISEVLVNVTGSAEAPGLKAEVQGALEFDGFYKIHLKLTPTGTGSFDSIRVEVPMPTEGTRLFNHSAEGMRANKTMADLDGLMDGIIWNSKSAAHNSLVKGNFLPTTWMGDEDRGVAWMCDHDKNWVTTFDKPCLDVVRKGKKTAFRMHLLNKPGELQKPLEVTFSLQATPVKPRPPGGSWKKERDYGWSYFDAPLIWTGCFDSSKSKRVEDHPGFDEEKAKRENRYEQAKRESQWWRYFCFNSDRISFDDPTYGQMCKDFAAEWYVDAPLAQVQNKLHADFILWAYKQWNDKLGLKGSYHDNTFCVAWPGLINNTGWLDDEGQLHAGYWVMAYREFAKRERAFWLSVGPPPVIKNHITDAPIIGYLGFADFWLDGENGGYPDPSVSNPDFVDRWYNRKGMANLRITLGRQWGTMPQYLYNWGKDSTEALLGLFEVRDTTVMAKNPKYDFGLKEADCEYIPYWDVRELVKVTKGGPDVLYAAWKRPGRVRVMVSNMADEDRDVTLKLDAAQLGLTDNAIVMDEQSFEAVPYTQGVIKSLRVNRHNYRVLLLGAPGVFVPTDPVLDKALEPKERIAALCDDFSTLRPEWKTIMSPLVKRIAGPQKEIISSYNGYLRVLTGSYTYSSVYRPFNTDNCSVQLKIRQMTGGCGPGFGPMLGLYWNKEKYVRILTGVKKQKTCCEGMAAGKGFRKEGEESGLLNWVKITLKPAVIEFHVSMDGKAWQKLHEQPRKGYEGAPVYLFIGHGAPGKNELMQNESCQESYIYYSYFGDLVIGRE